MTHGMSGSRDDVLEANVRFHSELAQHYAGSQPYFDDDINRARVTGIIERSAERSGNQVLLDLGCGTGFICSLARSHFDRIVGVDATPRMLSLVEPAPNIKVALGDIRRIPLDDSTANVCTAYGVLHHIEHLQAVVAEVYRVLKPGGTFYSDEDPNEEYFEFLHRVDSDPAVSSDLVTAERDNVLGKARQIQEDFGVDEEITRLAEFQKMTKGGMDPRATRDLFVKIGFVDVRVQHRWFLGEASLRKNAGVESETIIDDYLTAALPMSGRLFKYFKLTAAKPLAARE